MTPEEREAEGLRRENTGITTQRRMAIADRFPEFSLLCFERENGVPVRARPGWREGARV